jgi:hypothetical protein
MTNRHWNDMTVDEKLDWLRRAHEMDPQATQQLAAKLDSLTKRMAALKEGAAGVEKPRR